MNFWPVAETLNQLLVQLLLNYSRTSGGWEGGLRPCSPHIYLSFTKQEDCQVCVSWCMWHVALRM